MNKEVIQKVVRLVVLAAALMILIHVLTHDDRSNWLALIPGAILASAIGHFAYGALHRAPSTA
ncbi:MAG: hypothetical protein ACR2QO_02135 [Acidimicrobiales bacterium]